MSKSSSPEKSASLGAMDEGLHYGAMSDRKSEVARNVDRQIVGIQAVCRCFSGGMSRGTIFDTYSARAIFGILGIFAVEIWYQVY